MKTETQKHTPGPWIAAGSYILAQRNPGGTKHHIAEASRDQPSQICQANARLIAAAPELLAALLTIAKHCEDKLPIAVAYPIAEAARAAIAKATGGNL